MPETEKMVAATREEVVWDKPIANGRGVIEEHRCGLGMCAPSWLQVLASKQAFLVTFCITWVLQGMYFTYFVSVITTIEKLFQLQSKTTGKSNTLYFINDLQ